MFHVPLTRGIQGVCSNLNTTPYKSSFRATWIHNINPSWPPLIRGGMFHVPLTRGIQGVYSTITLSFSFLGQTFRSVRDT
jgi:hypothetical protein